MLQQDKRDAAGKAVALLLLGVAGGLALDLCAKALLVEHPLHQFVFLRSLIGLVLFVLLAVRFGGIRTLATKRWRWHFLRTLLATCTMFGFFYGLANMPLVEALTLGFTAPLMTTALSKPLLGDHVGWRRWMAVIAGFAGVVIILEPGGEPLTLASAAVLLAAFCYACLAITARHLADTESGLSLSTWVIAGPMIVAGAVSVGQDWVVPDAFGWTLFVMAGASSVIAWIGLVGAYRIASPALLAPFEYTALPAGALAGWLIWNEVPGGQVAAGAALIVAAGLFVAYREVGYSNRYLRLFAAGVAAVLARRRQDPDPS